MIAASSGVTSAHDLSLESSQSNWSTKFCKLFLRVADKQPNFLRKGKLFNKKLDKNR